MKWLLVVVVVVLLMVVVGVWTVVDGNCIPPCLNSQTLYFLGGGGAHFFFLQSSSPQGQPIAKSGAGFFTEMSIPVGQRRSQNGRVEIHSIHIDMLRFPNLYQPPE